VNDQDNFPPLPGGGQEVVDNKKDSLSNKSAKQEKTSSKLGSFKNTRGPRKGSAQDDEQPLGGEPPLGGEGSHNSEVADNQEGEEINKSSKS